MAERNLVTHFLCIGRLRKGFMGQGFRMERILLGALEALFLSALAGLSHIRVGWVGDLFKNGTGSSELYCYGGLVRGVCLRFFEAVITNDVCCIAIFILDCRKARRFEVDSMPRVFSEGNRLA